MTNEKSPEQLAEEMAKKYAREFGGFPRGTSLIAVNGHTRGWDDCMEAVAQPLRDRVEELSKCPNEAWECARIQRRLEARVSSLTAALEKIASVGVTEFEGEPAYNYQSALAREALAALAEGKSE